MEKINGILIIAIAVVLAAAGLISAAQAHGYIGVDTEGGNIVINASGSVCQEDWSGSTWSQCVNGTQVFICFDRNNCGTTSLRPELCGAIQECGEIIPSNGDGGSSGGGSSGGGGIFSTISFYNFTAPSTGNKTEAPAYVPLASGGISSFAGNQSPAVTGGLTGGAITILTSGTGLTLMGVIVIIAAGVLLIFVLSKNKPKKKKGSKGKSRKH